MKRESSRPFLPDFPDLVFPETLAAFLKIADAKGFLQNDGAGNFTWVDAPIGGGSTGPAAPSGSLGELGDALRLFWLYGDESPNFELFGGSFSFRDTAPLKVLEATAGDDTLDLETTEGLKVGATYVISDANGAFVETVEIARILTPKRLRTRLSLGHTLTEAQGAKLARTSADVLDRFAVFSHGDEFYTRPLDALRLQDRGRLILRRSSDGTGTFAVSFRLAGESAWGPAKRTEVRSRLTGFRDEEYEIATGGDVELRIAYAGATAAGTERVEFMVLGTIPRSEAASFVEQPVNAAPAADAINVGQTPVLTGSPYRSLYGLEQGGAHFQVARDPLFTDIVVNSSNDWLASWVSKSGYTQNWKGLLALAANRFLAVADGVCVRLDQSGAITTTGTVTGDLRCVAGDASLVVAAGAGGTIRTSTDEGATFATRASAGSYAGTFNGAASRGNRVCLVGTGGEIEFAANGTIFGRVVPDGAFAGDFMAISGDGSGNVIAVGTGGCIQTASNDGQGGWIKREAPGGYTGTLRAVDLLANGFGIAVGDNGAVFETGDFGATWRNGQPDPAFAGRFTAVACAAGKAVIVGEGGAIQTKALPGGPWIARSAAGGASGAFRAVALDPNADALALGDAGLVQRTSRISGASISYTVPAGSDMLKTGKIYHWRARYSDGQGRWSPWSQGSVFATSDTFAYVRQPENVAPASGDDAASTTPTLQAGAFSVVGAPDTHARSRWQVARDLSFSQLVYDSGESADLTSHALPAGSPLADQQTFYWRVAYKGAANGFSSFSAPTAFKTRARPNRPVITAPAAGATNVSIAPTITTAAFSMPGGGVHEASRYQVSATSSFASLVYDSGWSTADKVSHTLPAGTLGFDTPYFVRVQHRESGGQASAFSSVVGFTTGKRPGVQNVFATTLHAGNGAARSVLNGLDNLGSGGLVWAKERTGTASSHVLIDTQRGANKSLASDSANAASIADSSVTGFRADGFDLGVYSQANGSARNFVAWNFRRAAKFFDIVTYVGNGVVGRRLPHALGIAPGMVIVKAVDAGTDWMVFHRATNDVSLAEQFALRLNSDASSSLLDCWNKTLPDAEAVTLSADARVNAAGRSYVAYVFAHDASADGMIRCGNYLIDGTGNVQTEELGWEPQWLLIKRHDGIGNWMIFDLPRDRDVAAATVPFLHANLSAGEALTQETIMRSATGFRARGGKFSPSYQSYIYTAIRKP